MSDADTSNRPVHGEVVVHPLASVDPAATLGAGTVVEAFAVVGPHVRLGEGCWVGSHAVLSGNVNAGARNQFFPFCSVGALSQDLWSAEDETWVVMADENVVRENVTINTGTSKEYGITSLGCRNNIMAGCHIAHDCVIGDGVVMANNVLLGGHVRIRDNASVGGAAAVHHFVTIGRRAFVGGLTRVIHDVPPWMLLEGNPARVKAVNVIGAERHQLPASSIQALREVYRRLYKRDAQGQRSRLVEELKASADLTPEVAEVLESLTLTSSGCKGRHLERYRTDGHHLDLEAVPDIDRPRRPA